MAGHAAPKVALKCLSVSVGSGVGNYGLQSDSPCAPENSDCGLLMGVYPVACGGTAARATSWSKLKSLY